MYMFIKICQLFWFCRSFMHFLTSVCAIVGGVFTGKSCLPLAVSLSFQCTCTYSEWGLVGYAWLVAVAGLVDAFIYHSARAIQKKIELGKYSWWPKDRLSYSTVILEVFLLQKCDRLYIFLFILCLSLHWNNYRTARASYVVLLMNAVC